MAEHLVTSGVFIASAFATLVYICSRFRVGPGAVRKYGIIALLAMLTIAGISAASITTISACPGNPAEDCEYNDSVPFMFLIALVYVIATSIKSWILYSER